MTVRPARLFLKCAYRIFEAPTGVVADTFSRRLSVIIGTLILGAVFILESSVAACSRIPLPHCTVSKNFALNIDRVLRAWRGLVFRARGCYNLVRFSVLISWSTV